MNHRKACIYAARYLKNKGIAPFHRCQYVVCELERVGECPDAFGWGASTTQLIEVKISRSDFLADGNKLWRSKPYMGLGLYRSYLCPQGLIQIPDLPTNWGLLYIDNEGIITEHRKPGIQESNHMEEINLITSILRRENIGPKIFSYKKYNHVS